MSQRRLEGKVAIITGAGSGIGKVAAAMFANAGARVLCADIDADAAHATAREVSSSGGEAFSDPVDVTSPESTESLARSAIKRFGRIDTLLHSAGVSHSGTALTTAMADWNRIITVNLTGTWLICKAVLPGMIERGGGTIVSLSSLAGNIGLPDKFAYSASKAGMIGMTRQMAADFAPDNIRINTICLGTVLTPMSMAVYAGNGYDLEGARRKIGERYPLGRPGTMEGVVNLALYLASDESEFLTGEAVPYDGGLTAIGWKAKR